MLESAKQNSINLLETDYPVSTLHTRSVSHSDFSLSLSTLIEKKKINAIYL